MFLQHHFITLYKIWPSTINGQADQVNTNDTINGGITITSSVADKKVLVEQFTGAWCGWCPDGYSQLNTIVNTNTNVIAVSIHDNDKMSTTSGSQLINDYAEKFPSATIDQYYFTANELIGIDRTNWNTYINQRLAMKVPATVTVTNIAYNSNTRQIDATVSTTFIGDVKGDYRLNLYVKENNVYGPIADSSDNNWNQHNNLFNIPSSTYYQYGNLIGNEYVMSSLKYKHQFVLDTLLDGAYGTSGIVPNNGSTNGQTYTKNYSYILPTPTNGVLDTILIISI